MFLLKVSRKGEENQSSLPKPSELPINFSHHRHVHKTRLAPNIGNIMLPNKIPYLSQFLKQQQQAN